jgi:hypothetical protein
LGRSSIEKDFKKIVKYCKVVRVIAHTQVRIFIIELTNVIYEFLLYFINNLILDEAFKTTSKEGSHYGNSS